MSLVMTEYHIMKARHHISEAYKASTDLEHDQRTTVRWPLIEIGSEIDGALHKLHETTPKEDPTMYLTAVQGAPESREMMSPQDIEIAINQIKWAISCIWVDYKDGAPEKLLYDAIREGIGNSAHPRDRGFKEFVRFVFDESGTREAVMNRIDEITEAISVANDVHSEVENFALDLDHLDD